jgi:hypothetical protein
MFVERLQRRICVAGFRRADQRLGRNQPCEGLRAGVALKLRPLARIPTNSRLLNHRVQS